MKSIINVQSIWKTIQKYSICILFICFSSTNNWVSAQTTDTYSAPGTIDWVVPACVTSVTVRAWGAGGAGGGARSTDRNGGGGGGGAFSIVINEPVTPGETLRITVGAGGAGVSAGTGGAGGFSQVQHLTGGVVFCRAAGGAGGQMGGSSSSAGAGGAGGQIANNIPVGAGFRGGNGGASDPNTGSADRSGGGGGGAGTGANGGNGGIVTAGGGGASGGGVGGEGRLTTSQAGADGFPGNTLGGGGGGSTCFSGANRAGAAGARGAVTFTYTVDCGAPDPELPLGASVYPYTTPGSYSWTVPSCVTVVKVEAWGAGGGGGGTIGIIQTAQQEPEGGHRREVCVGGGGGAGGGYTSRTIAVTPGQVYTIVVGAGGTAGAAGTGTWNGGISSPGGSGGTGQTSSFTGNGINLQATGGSGGGGASGYNTSGTTCLRVDGAAGVIGGTGSGGSVNFTGGTGAVGYILSHSTDKSGGGGGAAGPGGDGGNAPHPSSVGVATPPGGTGNAPGGNGGVGRMTNNPGILASNGDNGQVIGGGGGGSLVHRDPYDVSAASGGIGGRGEVRLSFVACPLPIELISFTGQCNGTNKTFEWQTASETNNDFFTIEASQNGYNFQEIKHIDGAGNSSATINYRTEVNSVGTKYYRLKQTDYDGQFTYSDIIYTSCSDINMENDIIVYPNPASDEININFEHTQKGVYQFTIYNVLGQSIYNAQHEKLSGASVSIPLNVASGQYIIRVTEESTGKQFTPAKFQVLN